MKYKAPRGTQDILPSDVAAWQELEAQARSTMERYGYREIRTPIFEQKELFLRTVGEETDIVQKEMYAFTDRKGREFALRPEGTAPVIRAYIENSLWVERAFQKLYYLGPMFRYDRPQKGRYRQFHQIGAEAVGSLSPLVDAEVIAVMGEILRAAGIRRLSLRLNSLGDAKTREAYTAALRDFFGARENDLCADCRSRLVNNPMRILDCKVESCKDLSGGIPGIEDHLSIPAREHYEQVQRWLGVLGIEYVRDRRLVRGLDYYTRTAFEYHHGELGSTVALGGGGRYDGLIRQCGGPDTPAIGFSLGTERVLLAAEKDRQTEAGMDGGNSVPALYLAWMGDGALDPAVRFAQSLRRLFRVEMDLEPKSLKAQLRQADKLGGVDYALILGEQELGLGACQFKNLRTGKQWLLRLEQLNRDLDRALDPVRPGAAHIDRVARDMLETIVASAEKAV